jgi:signal transduction histidine kinase
MLYSLILVLISIPVSFFFIQRLLNEEVDESLAFRLDQFEQHIKQYETLEDIETDLSVMDRLIIDIEINPASEIRPRQYTTVEIYDSLENERGPFRELSTGLRIQNKNYQLVIRTSLVDNNDLVGTLVIVQAMLAVLLATVLVLLNRSLSRRLWEPFYSTLSQLKAYELDKSGSITTGKTNIIEFDDLNQTIHYLTERNRQVFLEQKEFIENASHELQTPLAIFQSKLDNLMQSDGMTEKDSQEILAMESAVKRMAQLNKNLLLLSKIENNQFTEVESIDVANLVSLLAQQMKSAGFTVRTSIQSLTITANRTLIEVLLTNLFQNAARYTPPGGNVVVELMAKSFRIANTGEPLTMDTDKIFKRFQKEAKNNQGTGIGLALVKNICNRSGYTVKYHYDRGMHAFTIDF